MHFLVDEGVDGAVVKQLRAEGHDVLYVAEFDPGISDAAVLDRANQQGRLLVTADKDFGELVFRMHRAQAGVVLLRLAGLSSEIKAKTVAAVVREYGSELPEAFSVVAPAGVRVRRRA